MSIRNIVIGSDKPWFIRKINTYWMSDRHKEVPDGYFRISGISQCARMMAYNFLGAAEYPSHDISAIKRMSRGTWHHGIWFDIFKAAGVVTRPGELLVCQDPPLRGTPDWIITDDEGLEWLIEWKSTTDYRDTVSWEYYAQWSLYACLLGIPRGYLVKEHPASWDLKPIEMKLDVNYVNQLLVWIHNIVMMTKDGVLPNNNECPYGKGCDIYQFCHSKKGDIKMLVEKTP